jgi:hypothetical protein
VVIPDLQLADLLALPALALVVALVVELVKRTAGLSDATVNRFGAAIAVGSGIAIRLGAAVALQLLGTSQDVGQGLLTGFLAGCVAAWGYDVIGDRFSAFIDQAGRVVGPRNEG